MTRANGGASPPDPGRQENRARYAGELADARISSDLDRRLAGWGQPERRPARRSPRRHRSLGSIALNDIAHHRFMPPLMECLPYERACDSPPGGRDNARVTGLICWMFIAAPAHRARRRHIDGTTSAGRAVPRQGGHGEAIGDNTPRHRARPSVTISRKPHAPTAVSTPTRLHDRRAATRFIKTEGYAPPVARVRMSHDLDRYVDDVSPRSRQIHLSANAYFAWVDGIECAHRACSRKISGESARPSAHRRG